MDATNTPKPKRPPLSAQFVSVLRSPIQFRVLSTIVILGGWYMGFAMPTTTEIDELTQKTTRETKRVQIATEVERLRAQVALFDSRLPKKTDSNEWVQYMLEGTRKFPDVKLSMIDTDGTKDVGPFKAVIIKMEVAGTFETINTWLRWVESNPRLLRVDSIRLDPRKDQGGMVAKLTVLGVMG